MRLVRDYLQKPEEFLFPDNVALVFIPMYNIGGVLNRGRDSRANQNGPAEHGFRGNADAGEHVASSVDPKTGVPILSLYDGKDRRPSEKSMRKFDILVVDIQDVGLRFYTYYITMTGGNH